ncbi:unnamed protein product [Mytilus coruscus]|uniref:Gustatory receptor n=1 Tax=Mytilus coruscus TaxID=42192 RepID=A0A6J8ELG6_MYTCO|nr:unnamed protein product [Mytilus coruscus]
MSTVPKYRYLEEQLSNDETKDVTKEKIINMSHSGEHQELQNASDMSGESYTSAIRVDIADLDGEDSLNLTTTTLRRCKQQILRPYWRLLLLIGWRGFGRESINSGSKVYSFLNTVYPVFIVLLLWYVYIYEIVACQWKLNVKKDTKSILQTSTAAITTISVNSTHEYQPLATYSPSDLILQNLSHSKRSLPPEACEHVITTYVIPNILHFVAFVMGFVHYRIHENEQLYAIMEKVFLQATPLSNRASSQHRMIKKLRLFQVLGALWVLSTLILQGMYEWAFDFPKLIFFQATGKTVHWVLFSIELLGTMVLNSVSLAVVANYVTQCEMMLFYIRGLALRLQEKSSDLRNAMKDVLSVRQNLSVLNGPMARMTSLICVIFCELTIIGISILVLNKNDLPKIWLYRTFFPVVFFVMLCFPLFQAARVNSVCCRIIKIALEMRVFGYKGSSQLDLDSFMNFVSNTKLRAKLFHIPIMPAYLITIIVLSCLVLLILFQTSIIGPINYWF